MTEKIYIILPVYNEAKSIYDLLSNYNFFFKRKGKPDHEILAINDCSIDNSESWITKAIQDFPELNINLIKHSSNKGLNGALLSGFSYLTEKINPNDIVITMDGDNTHNPFLIDKMINKIYEGADIVIASRYCEQSRIHGLSWFRTFLSQGARYLYSSKWHIPGVKDYTCGFRAFKGQLIKDSLNKYQDKLIQEKGFTATAELLKKLSYFNPVIVEVPMILKYSNKLEKSNMQILKTIKLTLKMLFKPV